MLILQAAPQSCQSDADCGTGNNECCAADGRCHSGVIPEGKYFNLTIYIYSGTDYMWVGGYIQWANWLNKIRNPKNLQ